MNRKSARPWWLVAAALLFCAFPGPLPAQTVSFTPVGEARFGFESRPQWVAVGDFNRDGVEDLAVANSGLNQVAVLVGNGDASFQGGDGVQAAPAYAVGPLPSSVAVGDFNRDGL
jgi:hypothetical protein